MSENNFTALKSKNNIKQQRQNKHMFNLQEYIKSTKVFVIFSFVVAMIMPILAPYLKSVGFSDVTLSLLFAIFPLAAIIISPIIGKISDEIGRNKIIFIGIVIEIAALILYGLGLNTWTIVIARIFDAIAGIILGVLALAKVEDHLSNKSRGKFAGISLSIQSAAGMIAPLIGGFLADYFFIKAPFILGIVILGILLFMIKEPKRKKQKTKISKKDFNWLSEIKEFLSYKKLRGMAILGFVFNTMNPAIVLFLPILITEYMGLSYFHVGLAYAALSAAHILQFIFGKWADRSAYKVIMIGSIISGTCAILIGRSFTFTLLLIVLFIRGIGNSMWNVSAWTLMSKIGEKIKLEGEIVGSYLSITKFGSLISYLASGFIVAMFGIRNLFAVTGTIIVIGAAIAFFFLKE